MKWLEWLDNLYKEQQNISGNHDFMYYPEVNFDFETTNVNIRFLKRHNKTRILFEDEFGRKVYFTDIDIIGVLLETPEPLYTLIMGWLIKFEKEEFENKINVEIVNLTFEIPLVFPVEYSKELKKNKFISVADFEISYFDLLVLISFIVDKELIVRETDSQIRRSRQLKKFVFLSNLYKNRGYEDALKKAGYNTLGDLNEVYSNSSAAKKIDKKFDAIEF